MGLFNKNKPEVPGCEDKAVQIAIGVAKTFDLIQNANSWKRRKQMGVTEEQMEETLNRLTGDFIEDKVSLMLLEHLMFNYAPKEVLDAYDELQDKTTAAVKGYLNDLVEKKNEEANRSDKKKV